MRPGTLCRALFLRGIASGAGPRALAGRLPLPFPIREPEHVRGLDIGHIRSRLGQLRVEGLPPSLFLLDQGRSVRGGPHCLHGGGLQDLALNQR